MLIFSGMMGFPNRHHYLPENVDFSSIQNICAKCAEISFLFQEIQHLREQLALKERELKTMKEQYDGCRKLYEEKRNALDEFM